MENKRELENKKRTEKNRKEKKRKACGLRGGIRSGANSRNARERQTATLANEQAAMSI
jgi:hypothetical protein